MINHNRRNSTSIRIYAAMNKISVDEALRRLIDRDDAYILAVGTKKDGSDAIPYAVSYGYDEAMNQAEFDAACEMDGVLTIVLSKDGRMMRWTCMW